ncbi:hypothetical protein GGR27_002681 [Lewinella antarctica]|uniref:Uncharacterized protein n=1 Tax=Neolewinella antarctica TaxID=442734 RepID=A0ABX0XEF0_9BACT|nr:hypothetical protein [Neolewinella antarctica]
MVIEQSIMSRFVEFLEGRPTDDKILKFNANEFEERRFQELVSRSVENLDFSEKFELEELKRANHLISMAKIRAYGRLERTKNE